MSKPIHLGGFFKKNWRALLCFSQRELPPISLFVLRLSRAGPRGRNHPFKIPCGQAQLESHADSDSPAWRCLKRVSERNHAPWPATARQAGRKPNARPQRVTWEARCALLHLMGARPEAALLAPRPPLRQGTARAFFPPMPYLYPGWLAHISVGSIALTLACPCQLEGSAALGHCYSRCGS